MKHSLPLLALLLLAVPAAAEETPSLAVEAPDTGGGLVPPTPPARSEGLTPPAPPDGRARPVPPPPPRNHMAMTGSATVTTHAADAFVFSGDAEVSGTVDDALFVMSGDVVISGRVGGDAYLFAGDLELTGTIEGDLYVFSGDADLKPGSRIEGRVFAYSGSVTMDGVVEDDVEVQSGRLLIGGTLRGDLDATAGEIKLRSGAVIEGDVDYTSGGVIQLEEGATIEGATAFTQQEVDGGGITFEVDVDDDDGGGGVGAVGAVVGLLMSLVFGGVLLWAGGPITLRAVDTAYERPAFHLGLGFGLAFLVPIVSAVACLFVLPIPLSITAMTLLVVGWFVGHIVAGTALGRFLLSKAGMAETSPFVVLGAGLVALLLVGLIPVLGPLTYIATCLVGLGAVFQTLKELRAEA